MKNFVADNYRYTAGFCEENIWWLVHSLVDEGIDIRRMEVVYFSNTDKSILVFNQRANLQGKPMLWDYHVVLQVDFDSQKWVFDFDSLLGFPLKQEVFILQTFPRQDLIPSQYQTWMRTIPAADYRQKFCSDRSHMKNHLPLAEFPDYPPIQPHDTTAIDVSDYWDMEKQINGSKVQMIAFDL